MENQIIQQQSFELSPVGQLQKQFEVTQQIGQMYASASIVPDIYKNNPANCAIATEMACRMNLNPIAVMQNLSIVQGKPSWSSKFLIACINTCGHYNPIKYKEGVDGKVGKVTIMEYVYDRNENKNVLAPVEHDCSHIDNYYCQAWTTRKDSDEILEGVRVDLRMAISEGWYTKKGSKWQTMPKLMLRYRAASMWVNTNDPSLSMGFMTQEEVQDVEWADYEEVPAKKVPASKAERMEMMRKMAEQATSAASELKNEPEVQNEENGLFAAMKTNVNA